MNLGTELKRDKCPEKYCSTSISISEVLPIFISSLIVAYFSGSLFIAAGIDFAVSVIIEIIFVIGLNLLFHFLFKGVKARLAETYISVCEYGICGVRAINGYKNGSFTVTYKEIIRVINKKERLIIDTQQGRLIFTLTDAPGIAELIRQKCA